MKYVFEYLKNFIEPAIREPFIGHTIKAYDPEGIQAGYIKVSYIPNESNFGTDFFEYLKLHNMVYGSWRENITRNEMIYEGLWPLLCDVKTLGHMEKDDELKRLEALPMAEAVAEFDKLYMPLIQKRFQKDWESEINYHVDKPMVDFIRVEHPYRGTGLAEELYIRAARWMRNEFNLPLRFSQLQSDPAKRIMEKFIKRGMVKTEQITMHPDREYTFNWIIPDNPS